MHTFELEFNEFTQKRTSHWNLIYKDFPNSLGDYYRSRLMSAFRNLVPEGARVLEIGCGPGELLAFLNPSMGVGVDFSQQAIDIARKNHPQLEFIQADAHDLKLGERCFDYIILSDLVNDLWDVQAVLGQVHAYCVPQTRIIVSFYSHLWNVPMRMAQAMGLARPSLTQNWLTYHDMINLFEIGGFEEVRHGTEVIFPLPLPWLANFTNRYIAKLWPFHYGALSNMVMARPRPETHPGRPGVSVIVAARNESGHIKELIERIPDMGGGTEIIFVEGNSTDDTFEEIERCIQNHPGRRITLLKQTGKGKGDAVRAGFEAASEDILMILDADITVPPEDLPRFYEVMVSGLGEFVNGVRLVYPMQDDAMRFLNLLGNKFFSWAFTWLLGQPIRDTLCGTKVLWKADYQRIAANRSFFGDFDPFGDFDLLFGAIRLNLKIKEVPIRYRARRYGETNISRWRHGWLLLKMVVFAARRIKFV